MNQNILLFIFLKKLLKLEGKWKKMAQFGGSWYKNNYQIRIF